MLNELHALASRNRPAEREQTKVALTPAQLELIELYKRGQGIQDQKPTLAPKSGWNWPAIVIIAIVACIIAFPPLLLIPFVIFVTFWGSIWARVFFKFLRTVAGAAALPSAHKPFPGELDLPLMEMHWNHGRDKAQHRGNWRLYCRQIWRVPHCGIVSKVDCQLRERVANMLRHLEGLERAARVPARAC